RSKIAASGMSKPRLLILALAASVEVSTAASPVRIQSGTLTGVVREAGTGIARDATVQLLSLDSRAILARLSISGQRSSRSPPARHLLASSTTELQLLRAA